MSQEPSSRGTHSAKGHRSRLRPILILISLVAGVSAAFHELLPEKEVTDDSHQVSFLRPPLMYIAVEGEKYMDSADCSQHNVVPRIVPCVQNPNPLALFPNAAWYAISSYLADARVAPRRQVVLTILCELASIILACVFVLAYFSGQFDNKPKWVQELVIIPVGLMAIPFGVWLVLTKILIVAMLFPAKIVESVSDGTIWLKIRSFKWGGALSFLFLFLVVFAVGNIAYRYELISLAIAAVSGVVLAALGWIIAPYLPSRWGKLIRSQRPDLLWAAAASTAGVTGALFELYILLIGSLGAWAATWAMVFVNAVPAAVWTWIERARIIGELREAYNEIKEWFR